MATSRLHAKKEREKEKSPAMTTARKEKPSDDLNSCLAKTLRLLLISLLQCIGFGTRRDLSSEWKSQLTSNTFYLHWYFDGAMKCIIALIFAVATHRSNEFV
ncbi:hypothetical protein Q1695_002785 [Nippostrongylus brasiliensis]|nr:hypothetical protein Q1695_002785 [Nippostrongylus brasiliensis]